MSKMTVVPETEVKSLQRDRKLYLFFLGLAIGILVFVCGRLYLMDKEHKDVLQTKDQTIQQLLQQIDQDKDAKAEYDVKVMKAAEFIKSNNSKIPFTTAIQYAKWEIHYARVYGVPVALGLSISLKESHWDTKATSPTGPKGIKQVAASYWAKELGIKPSELYNPEKGIAAGYAVIARYKADTKSWDKALEKYYGSEYPMTNRKYAQSVLMVASRY